MRKFAITNDLNRLQSSSILKITGVCRGSLRHIVYLEEDFWITNSRKTLISTKFNHDIFDNFSFTISQVVFYQVAFRTHLIQSNIVIIRFCMVHVKVSWINIIIFSQWGGIISFILYMGKSRGNEWLTNYGKLNHNYRRMNVRSIRSLWSIIGGVSLILKRVSELEWAREITPISAIAAMTVVRRGRCRRR